MAGINQEKGNKNEKEKGNKNEQDGKQQMPRINKILRKKNNKNCSDITKLFG